MKKLINGLLFLVLVGMIMVGCEKEDSTNPTLINQTNVKSNKQVSKSSYTDFELMCMAANVESITYISSTNSYEVEVYGSSAVYAISIVSFDDEDYIDMEISDGTNSYDQTLDVDNETIALSSIHSSSFDGYESYEFSSSQNVFENISNIILVHHSAQAQESVDFDDNGSGDIFPESGGGELCGFWRTHKTAWTPCINGEQASGINRERFGICFTNEQTRPC